MPNPKPGIATTCLIACLLLLACTATVQEPTAAPTLAPVTVPVTVEVTRIVPQQVIVETTPTPPQACVPATFEDAQAINIGAILPLSSPGSLLNGFAMQTALNIAVTELNEAGGIRGLPVRLITYDSAGQPEQAAAYARRLIMEDCVAAITGLYHNRTALAVAEKAANLNMPLIVAGASADSVTAAQYRQVFRIAPTDTMLANMPAVAGGSGRLQPGRNALRRPHRSSRTADSLTGSACRPPSTNSPSAMRSCRSICRPAISHL